MLPLFERAEAVSLRGLFPQAKFLGGTDIEASSCVTDVAACQPGDLFVAVAETDRDGHEDVAEAVRRGAVGVLAERLVVAPIPTCLVGDTRIAHGQLCHALSGHPARELRLAGIAGTHGKTVTSHLLASILRRSELEVGVISSLSAVSPLVPSSDDATPAAPQLADSLRRMTLAGQSHAIVELSAAGLATRRVAGLGLDAAILTNIRRDPWDADNSLIRHRRVQARLFEQLNPNGFAVLNVDDAASHPLLDKLKHPVFTIGMRNEAELSARVLDRQAFEQTFLLEAGREALPVRTAMIGDHHIYNCLAAAAVALTWGIDLDTIVRGLEAVTKLPGRLERIDCGQPFNVFVDAARAPDSLTAALKTVRQVTRGRVLCVLGAQGERCPGLRPQVGRVVERLAHVRVLTSDNPRHEAPLETIHGLLDGFQRPQDALIRPDRLAAIEWALEHARPGDSVVIAGKGETKTQEIDGQRLAWDDRRIARDWLYAAARNESLPSANHTPGIPELKIFG
jgi:UDP-N-acetylmuramoyl-L-alanyl-D-glutamate--2,6-diaminopimelate ligase